MSRPGYGENPETLFHGLNVALCVSTMSSGPILKLVEMRDGHAKIRWDGSTAQSTPRYRIFWWKEQDEKETDITDTKEYVITNLKSGFRYRTYVVEVDFSGNARLSAVSNMVDFNTAPRKPANVVAETYAPSPQDSILVRFKNNNDCVGDREIEFEAVAHPLSQKADVRRAKTTTESVVIREMMPGESYNIYVRATDGAQWSGREYLKSIAQTYPEVPMGVKLTGNNQSLALSWKPLNIKPRYYEVFWEENGRKHSEEVHDDRFHLSPLNPSTTYKLRVAAVNDAGQSLLSDEIIHTTVPSKPTGLKVQIISIHKVIVFLDKMDGVLKYHFNVEGKKYVKHEPRLVLDHEITTTRFTVQASAENAAGLGPPSDSSEVNHTLLYLKRKFEGLANNEINKDRFVTPLFDEIPLADTVTNFGSILPIPNGNTVMVFGDQFTGKTACCTYFLQNLPDYKLGIYLDWDEWEQIARGTEVDVVSLLLQRTERKSKEAELSEEEVQFVYNWMRSNTDKVVLVIDNLSFPPDFDVFQTFSDGKAESSHIMYRLVSPNKEVFPESQVFCTTSQRDIKQIVKPAQMLQITGFDEEQVKRMKTAIGYGTDDHSLPRHLEYFCKNPWYCNSILRLIKQQNPNIRLTSMCSVLLHLISESVELYAARKKTVKLQQMLREVMQMSRNVGKYSISSSPKRPKSMPRSSAAVSLTSSISSSTTSFSLLQGERIDKNTKHTCGTLHDTIAKALYLGFFCPYEQFKANLKSHKKDLRLGGEAKMWAMAVGLLREESVNFSTELFVLENDKQQEIDKKRHYAENFLVKNFEGICKEVYVDSQTAMDWFDVINEVDNEKILSKCTMKIRVKNRMETEEVEQISLFLRQIPARMCQYVAVTLGKNLTSRAETSIRNAVAENSSGKMILIEKSDTTSLLSWIS